MSEGNFDYLYQIRTLCIYNDLCQNGLKDNLWYGGAFFGSSGEFNLQVTNEFHYSHTDSEITGYFNEELNILTVERSYHHLQSKFIELSEIAEQDSNIAGIGVDEERNQVVLAVLSDEERYIDEDCIVVTVSDFELHTDISPTDRLTNHSCSFSLGYPVIRKSSGISGFITAGHLSGIAQGDNIYYDNRMIGVVYEYENSETMDAAFIKTEETVNVLDRIAVAPNPVISGLCPCLIQGANIVMYSGESAKYYTGRLVYPQFDFMNRKNIMIFSYVSNTGDSGAPILLNMNEEKCPLVGIHLGACKMNGNTYSFGLGADVINERFSLELN